jgi:hexosaminidase
MMLDVSRHFFTVSQVKQIINIMASYKLNNFHWHLTDGQGWRIEIKKYPKLTQVGGTRLLTSFGGNRDWPDNVPYTGFYTQDEIRDVVQYAAERFINIVPEIEMPAHSDAALRAYPELKCIPAAGSTNPNRGNSIYCPTEETFTFLEGVLTEVMALFPSKFIHIGGDEANKQPWIESQYAQDLKKRLNLKDEHEMQSYFIQRIEKFINSKGRSIIGWDEILEGGLAPNATVMSWQGEQGGIAAAQQKHNVIMSPQTNGLYFDHYYSRNLQEPVSFPRYASLSDTYNYNPVSKVLTPEEQKYVIGAQGNLWTEYVPTFAKLQFQVFPRMFALSEVAWSKVENKDYKQFADVRLAKHFGRLEAMNFNFRVPPAFEVIDTMVIGSKFTYAPKSVIPGAKIYYTLNGRNPSDADWEYQSPITFEVPANEKREFKTTVITPNGRRSLSTRILMYNRAPLAATSLETTNMGLNFKLFNGTFTAPEQLDKAVADSAGTATDLVNEPLKRGHPNMGMIYEGYLNIPADGIYNLSLSSFTDAALWIDDQKLIQNEESTPLMKGFHKIKINYIYNAPPPPPAGVQGFRQQRPAPLRVYVSEAGKARKEIEVGSLYY